MWNKYFLWLENHFFKFVKAEGKVLEMLGVSKRLMRRSPDNPSSAGWASTWTGGDGRTNNGTRFLQENLYKTNLVKDLGMPVSREGRTDVSQFENVKPDAVFRYITVFKAANSVFWNKLFNVKRFVRSMYDLLFRGSKFSVTVIKQVNPRITHGRRYQPIACANETNKSRRATDVPANARQDTQETCIDQRITLPLGSNFLQPHQNSNHFNSRWLHCQRDSSKCTRGTSAKTD